MMSIFFSTVTCRHDSTASALVEPVVLNFQLVIVGKLPNRTDKLGCQHDSTTPTTAVMASSANQFTRVGVKILLIGRYLTVCGVGSVVYMGKLVLQTVKPAIQY